MCQIESNRSYPVSTIVPRIKHQLKAFEGFRNFPSRPYNTIVRYQDRAKSEHGSSDHSERDDVSEGFEVSLLNVLECKSISKPYLC